MTNDTIVSIATGLSNSGISIIRISGDESFNIIDKIYKSKSEKKILSKEKSHTIHYGNIINDDKIIDEVIVSIFRGPNSYTRENVIEINCHGGIIVTKSILNLVVDMGARIAEPGEFTKRAFLNGRIDLSQAEAVMDIINSKNEFALKNSMNHLNGYLKNIIIELRNIIIHDIAYIESALDDPENYSLDGFSDSLLSNINLLEKKINKLLNESLNAKIIKDGIKTVIVGKPNAGKSSLLNTLLNEERAIVTEIAGTTRDVLEESINIRGISLNLIDTAGIRDTADYIEKIGVEKSKRYIDEGDLILYVVDSSNILDEDDFNIIKMIKNKNVIILLNKSDLVTKTKEEDILSLIKKEILWFSSKERSGLSDLYDIIYKMFYQGHINVDEEIYITKERHKEALNQALYNLALVKESIINKMPEDFITIDLMAAYINLGNILGEQLEDDLVDVIFSEFCMGK